MRIYAQAGLTLLAIVAASTPAAAGDPWWWSQWFEDFDHNNPALYTNLNGQPDNLTIVGGIAYFGGVGGAYYGRPDLLIQRRPGVGGEQFAALESYTENPAGTIGIGWFSPSLNQGISVRVDADQNAAWLLRHDGWNSSTVLNSRTSIPTTLESIGLYWRGGLLWESIAGPTNMVAESDDMFFFMYGNAGPSGSGNSDRVWAYNVPEPLSVIPFCVGATMLFVRRKKRGGSHC